MAGCGGLRRKRQAGLAVHPGPVTLIAPGGVSVIFPNPLAVEQLSPVLIGTNTGFSVAVAAFLAATLVSLAVRYRAGGPLPRQARLTARSGAGVKEKGWGEPGCPAVAGRTSVRSSALAR